MNHFLTLLILTTSPTVQPTSKPDVCQNEECKPKEEKPTDHCYTEEVTDNSQEPPQVFKRRVCEWEAK